MPDTNAIPETTAMPGALPRQKEENDFTTLHLEVNNHPGVMSHICGLFARRAFNLEGILVTPADARGVCDVWLLVNEDARMPQIVNQVKKLHDVRTVSLAAVSGNALRQISDCLPQ